jgi:hypothetical protein
MSVLLLCVLMQECHNFQNISPSLSTFHFQSICLMNSWFFLQFQTFCKFIFYSSVIIVKVYLSGPAFSDNFYLTANFSHTVPCNLHLSQFSQYLQFIEQYLTHLFFWKEVPCYTVTFYCLKCLVNTVVLSMFYFPFFITVHNKITVCKRPFYWSPNITQHMPYPSDVI